MARHNAANTHPPKKLRSVFAYSGEILSTFACSRVILLSHLAVVFFLLAGITWLEFARKAAASLAQARFIRARSRSMCNRCICIIVIVIPWDVVTAGGVTAAATELSTPLDASSSPASVSYGSVVHARAILASKDARACAFACRILVFFPFRFGIAVLYARGCT